MGKQTLELFGKLCESFSREGRRTSPSVIHAASNHLNGLVSNVVGKHFAIPTIYEIRGCVK